MFKVIRSSIETQTYLHRSYSIRVSSTAFGMLSLLVHLEACQQKHGYCQGHFLGQASRFVFKKVCRIAL